MDLKVQKRLASDVLDCSPKRVLFKNSPEQLQKIKEAITKADIRSLINQGLITEIPARGISRGRNRHRIKQKRKGRVQGDGARKGKKTSRLPRKRKWINTIRTQRRFLAELKLAGKLPNPVYRDLYMKSKGGFFRSRAHLQLYLQEHNLIGGKDVKSE